MFSSRHLSPLLLAVSVALVGPACGGKAGGSSFSSRDGGSGDGSASSSSGGTSHSDASLACVTLPDPSPSDLACDTDGDCSETWSGTVCCGCNCPGAPANNAAQARDQAALSSVLSDPACPVQACGCFGDALSRCIAHQCTLCASPGNAPLPGQPAACDGDAGLDDQ